jgi:REP element-mobilizing transposase RayT
MPRPNRCDYPGALHHVINRGLGHRALFFGERDVRAFQALLAIQARWRRIEILVFSFLATHFHLLVRSLDGCLAGTMQWVGSMYGRYFNRTRARDGHVYRGRYLSRLVEDVVYLTNVITYIDFNAVKARMSPTPETHGLGSAAAYLGGRVPPWQATHTALSLAARLAPGSPGGVVDYRAIWRHAGVEEGTNLAELAVQAPSLPLAPIGALVQSGPPGVQDWCYGPSPEDGSAARCLFCLQARRAGSGVARSAFTSLPAPARQRLPTHAPEVGLRRASRVRRASGRSSLALRTEPGLPSAVSVC